MSLMPTVFQTEKERSITKLTEIYNEILQHGFGEMRINISEIKQEFKTKVVIWAGRSWMFIVDKDMPDFRKDNIL